MATETPKERVMRLVRELGVARVRDFRAAGVHQQYVAEACKEGVIERIGRGTYSLPGRSRTHNEKIVEACKRVPSGVVCLSSALWFHGLLEEEPHAIWMMLPTNVRLPQIDSLSVGFVFASGDAFTQGVMNLGIDGVPIRVYSPMKTVADCFKYADKVGELLGPNALEAAVTCNKYNRQRLLRFAEICRVKQAVSVCEKARRTPVRVEPKKGEEAPLTPLRVWDRETLAREVWEVPIRQLANKYGTSDVAIHKHCKKMGVLLPGRGYWAKQAK